MVELVLTQRNNAAPTTKPTTQCLLFFLTTSDFPDARQPYTQDLPSVLLLWKKLGKELILGSQFLFHGGCEALVRRCWAQCRALSESSGPGLVCYWEALTLRQALPVTTTNGAPDPTKWFHRTGKKWWLGKLFHNAVLFTWSSSSQRDQTGGSLTQSGGIKEAEFCASEMLKGPWHLAKDGERPLQEEWTSRAKLEGREGR